MFIIDISVIVSNDKLWVGCVELHRERFVCCSMGDVEEVIDEYCRECELGVTDKNTEMRAVWGVAEKQGAYRVGEGVLYVEFGSRDITVEWV